MVAPAAWASQCLSHSDEEWACQSQHFLWEGFKLQRTPLRAPVRPIKGFEMSRPKTRFFSYSWPLTRGKLSLTCVQIYEVLCLIVSHAQETISRWHGSDGSIRRIIVSFAHGSTCLKLHAWTKPKSFVHRTPAWARTLEETLPFWVEWCTCHAKGMKKEVHDHFPCIHHTGNRSQGRGYSRKYQCEEEKHVITYALYGSPHRKSNTSKLSNTRHVKNISSLHSTSKSLNSV